MKMKLERLIRSENRDETVSHLVKKKKNTNQLSQDCLVSSSLTGEFAACRSKDVKMGPWKQKCSDSLLLFFMN